MKLKSYSRTILVVLLISLFGCKKPTETAPVPTSPATTYGVLGVWEGTYLTDQVSHQPTYSSFVFYTDGSLLFKARGVPPAQSVIFCKGRWSLSNHTLSFVDTTMNYTSTLIQKGSLYYDSTKNILTSGTWQDVTADAGVFYTGTFPSMQKDDYLSSTQTYPVPGLWEGTYQTDQVVHTPTYSGFVFYNDGSFTYKAKGIPPAQSVIFCKGNWTVSGASLTFTDTTINYSSTLIQKGTFLYDNTKNSFSASTWQDVTADAGVFYTGTFSSVQKVK